MATKRSAVYKLNFKRTSNRYSKQDLFDNIEKVWNHLKRQPTINDMTVHPSQIHFGTYYNHFGSWKKALHSFVKYKNNGDTPVEPRIDFRKKRKTISNTMRFEVMERDRFKCKLCGKSPATNPRTILEIDHIKPICKGGTNEISNLRTLCGRCNNGKGSK